MYSSRDLLMHSICDIPPQNTLLPFSKSVVPSVLTPSGVLRIFWFFSLFGEYLGRGEGAHVAGFSFRQRSNHARTWRTLDPSETIWKLKQNWLSMQWPIVRKGQLDNHAKCIDATLDSSCSLPSTIFNGRHTLHVRRLSIPQVSYNMSCMCAHLRKLQKQAPFFGSKSKPV